MRAKYPWIKLTWEWKWDQNQLFPFQTVIAKDIDIDINISPFHRVCSATGATRWAGKACSSGVPEFTPGFSWIGVARSLVSA